MSESFGCLLKALTALKGQGLFIACLATVEEWKAFNVARRHRTVLLDQETNKFLRELEQRLSGSPDAPEVEDGPPHINQIDLEIEITSSSQTALCIRFYRGVLDFLPPNPQLLAECVCTRSPQEVLTCETYLSRETWTKELLRMDTKCIEVLGKAMEEMMGWEIENRRMKVRMDMDYLFLT